jgi:hypothetical protein
VQYICPGYKTYKYRKWEASRENEASNILLMKQAIEVKKKWVGMGLNIYISAHSINGLVE